jgi:hypothetical protein
MSLGKGALFIHILQRLGDAWAMALRWLHMEYLISMFQFFLIIIRRIAATGTKFKNKLGFVVFGRKSAVM